MAVSCLGCWSTVSGVPMTLDSSSASSFARRHEHAVLERARELVVARDRAVDRAAQLLGVIGERAEAAVELLAQVEQSLRVLGEHVLLPGERHRLQNRPQVDGRGERDVLAERVVEQARVVLERRGEQRLARDECDREVGARVEPRPVGLRRERVDVALDLLGVLAEERLAPGLLFARSRSAGSGSPRGRSCTEPWRRPR